MNLRAQGAKLALPLVAAVTVVLLGPLAPAEAAAPMLLDIQTGVDSSNGSSAGVSEWLGLVPDRVADATCGLLSAVPVGGDVLCTHGPDTAPAAAAGGDRAGAAVPTRGLTCVDGGTSGQRVEVLYVYGPNGSAASSARRTDVRRWVEQVEWTVTESAQRLSGDRRVRWLMPGCELPITSVRVSSSALRDFATFMDELDSAGFRRSDRTYLTFTDATTYCGIATAPQDDDATNNASERLTGFARVDRTCWDAGDDGFHSIAAHELFHTLGAVQPSAPNGTPGSHCTDEHDVLCYDDGTGSGMRSVCRDGSSSTAGAGDLNDRLLDCRGDDYFNPSPSSGSYLARNWNTADHARLHDPNAPKKSSGSAGGGTSTQAPTLSSDPIGYAMHRIFG